MSKRTGLLIVGAIVLIAVIAAVSALLFTGGDNAKLPETAAVGPSPTLPQPTQTALPTTTSHRRRAGRMARNQRQRADLA